MSEYVSNPQELLELLKEAQSELMQAQNFFENVSDPDLVDYAIYKMEAARKKYVYLIKRARISGVVNKHVIIKEAHG